MTNVGAMGEDIAPKVAPRLRFAPGSLLVPPATAVSLVIETGWVGLFKKHRQIECPIGVLLPGDRIEQVAEHCQARALTPVALRIDGDPGKGRQELDHIFRQCARSRLTATERV